MISAMKEKVIFCWSSGKDSAFALFKMIQSGLYEISCLLTTITEGYDRISMHGVRRALFEKQATQIGLSFEEVFIPQDSNNDEYEARMAKMLSAYIGQGVTGVAFGDIFLEDLRERRVANLAKMGLKGIFPLWKQETSALAQEFVRLGFKAIVSCVDTHALPREFCGREFDGKFLSELPIDVDPCGEKGEFHTFVYAGPLFKQEIRHTKGEVVLREGRFCFCDILLQ
jgi:uncharacterized protein (TIGR00290 family)